MLVISVLVISVLDPVLRIGAPDRCWLLPFLADAPSQTRDCHARPMLVIGAPDSVQK